MSYMIVSRCSSVSIATRLRAGRLGFHCCHGQGFFFATVSRLALRTTQPPIQLVSGKFSPEIKWPGREAGYLPPSSAEVKNAWSCTSTSPYVFMEWCLV